MNYNLAVKIIRAATNLSQTDFAKKIGIERSLLSRIENGKRTPTQRTLDLITERLGIPHDLIEMLAKEEHKIGNLEKKDWAKIGKELLNLLIKAQDDKQ